jgi:hypothetical protein
VGTSNHNGHSLSEKFDYLKPSKEIVGGLFADLDDIVDKVASSNSTEDIESFKLKLKMNYFPSLIEILRKIEASINEQIDVFNKHCSASIKTVKENSVKLKEHCVEGLNELKYQLDIENMLRDEGIFLHFDYKVKEMTNEKQRIVNDTEKLDKIIKSFGFIKKKLESIYSEIKVFLEGYLNVNIYSEGNKITESVEKISKDNIMAKLLSEFKRQNGRIISDAKNLRSSSNSNFITKALGSTVFNLNDTFQQNNINNITNFSTLPNSKFNTSSNVDLDNSYNVNTHINTDSKATTGKEREKSAVKDNISDHNIMMEFEKNTKMEDINFIIKANESDNKLVVYVDSNETKNKQKVFDRTVKFNPSIHGISNFLKNIATVNTGKLLYISGGELSPGISSDLFFLYNPIIHSLQRRENMPVAKHSHSLVFSNDFIYSVGGYKTNTCEKFDTKTGKWTKLSSLNCEERTHPILYVHNGFLYCFFGYSSGEYLNTVERLNIKSTKSRWEPVPYNNPSNIELGRIGSGIISTKDGIHIIAGKNKEILSSVLFYDFKQNNFILQDFNLEEPSYFKESNFIKFKDGDHGLFNVELNQLLKLDLN